MPLDADIGYKRLRARRSSLLHITSSLAPNIAKTEPWRAVDPESSFGSDPLHLEGLGRSDLLQVPRDHLLQPVERRRVARLDAHVQGETAGARYVSVAGIWLR